MKHQRNLREGGSEEGMEIKFNYITDYPLDLCLEYMKHDNIYDEFTYIWEEKEDYCLITFTEYKNSIKSLATSPKPSFKVRFENMGNQTGISVQFARDNLQPLPFVYTKDIDTFWEKKLSAKRLDKETCSNGDIMNQEKRKEYLIYTLTFWCIGFVLYGGLAVAGRELLNIHWNIIFVVLVYGFGGGLLLGGLFSGIILFIRFIKNQKVSFKILLCIFFPITIILICQIGILSFIPYEIYNFICLKRKNAA